MSLYRVDYQVNNKVYYIPSKVYIVKLLLALGNISHLTKSIFTQRCQKSILRHQYGFLALPHGDDV